MSVIVGSQVRKGWMFLIFAAGDLVGAIVLVASFQNGWLGGGLSLVGIAMLLLLGAFVMAFLGMRELMKSQEAQP
jgi:hypothetical protein